MILHLKQTKGKKRIQGDRRRRDTKRGGFVISKKKKKFCLKKKQETNKDREERREPCVNCKEGGNRTSFYKSKKGYAPSQSG